MNRTIISGPPTAPVQIPMSIPARRKYHVPEPIIKFPPRKRGGPVYISILLSPVLEIGNYPDRNRLLAEFSNKQKEYSYSHFSPHNYVFYNN